MIEDNRVLNKTLENGNNESQILYAIRKEYIRNILTLVIVFGICAIFLIYTLTLTELLKNNPLVYLIFIADGILLCLLILIYYLGLSLKILTPRLIKFIQKELNSLDLQIERRFKVSISNILVTLFLFVFSLLIFYFMAIKINPLILIRILIVITILILTIPTLRGKVHDKLTVKLISDYKVNIDIEFKLVKHKELDSHIIRVYMTSNKINLKKHEHKVVLTDYIGRESLLRNVRLRILNINFKTDFYFYVISSLINFKDNILNLISNIREWDTYIHSINPSP